MAKFTDEDLSKLNEKYAHEDVPFDARPLNAAVEILGDQFSTSAMQEITEAYEKLFPEVNFTWPAMGTGIAASLDRVRKVKVGVVLGTVELSPAKVMGFDSEQQWWDWCGRDTHTAYRSAYAVADMFDLVYGIDDQRHAGDVTHWGLAADNLRLMSESLALSGAISSPVLQPICLAAELAMKGTLLRLGVPGAELRATKKFGHNLEKLAERMVQDCSHRDDALLLRAVSRFPDYVDSRYSETSMSRLDVIALALDAQFIAASSVRRICTDRDIALQMETGNPGPRANLFP